MLTAYPNLEPASEAGFDSATLASALWIDLVHPTTEELRAVEAVLGVELPSRQEAEEIEASSRLYSENGTLFMIATVMVNADTPQPGLTPITFAFQRERVVTVRFAEPKPIALFERKLRRAPGSYPTAQKLLLGLLDEIIDRVADILEVVGADLNRISALVFTEPQKMPGRSSTDFTTILSQVGLNGLRAANARESLVSLSRIPPFFAVSLRGAAAEPPDDSWQTVGTDITSLSDHATFMSGKVNFFLDATLGRINNEQNTIIKLFSVLAVVFLPPTLIASIYGMNFDHMPELRWLAGYPLSLVLMVVAAVFPYLLFKRKGWL